MVVYDCLPPFPSISLPSPTHPLLPSSIVVSIFSDLLPGNSVFGCLYLSWQQATFGGVFWVDDVAPSADAASVRKCVPHTHTHTHIQLGLADCHADEMRWKRLTEREVKWKRVELTAHEIKAGEKYI